MSDQTTVDASTSVPDDDRITPEILKVAGVVVLGAIMSILDITVVNVALPTFQKAFDVTELSTVAWSVTGYTLALAAVIPLTRNYRSTQPILDAADRLIAHNPNRHGKSLRSAAGKGPPLSAMRLEDETAEAEHIAREISELTRRRERRPLAELLPRDFA